MAVRKPGIPTTSLNSKAFLDGIRICLEIIMGRRSGKAKALTELKSKDVSVAPTAADYNNVVSDIETIKTKINEIIGRLQDGT